MKKIKGIIILFIIAIIIGGIYFLYSILGNSKYDLKNISDNQKQEIIALLNCSKISNNIELKEMKVHKVYKDIYYNIYFKTINEDIKKYITESDFYGRYLKELNNKNYCCTIYRKDDKNIDILEDIVNGSNIDSISNDLDSVEDYTENSNNLENNQSNNNSEDVTQKISDNKVVHSGIIENIDEKSIHYSDSDSKKINFEKDIFSFINGRTFKAMELADAKVGDYIYPYNKQILVFRNLSGEDLNQELLYNLTLTDDEKIIFVNSVEIEEINVTAENTAIVKISYGDIIGNDLTNERFSALVEFNANTKYYSKGNNINSVNDLDNAKGNINSILLEKDSINKKNPAIVISFECDDT